MRRGRPQSAGFMESARGGRAAPGPPGVPVGGQLRAGPMKTERATY